MKNSGLRKGILKYGSIENDKEIPKDYLEDIAADAGEYAERNKVSIEEAIRKVLPTWYLVPVSKRAEVLKKVLKLF